MPVLDASIVVEYLASGEHAEAARACLLGADSPLWAPHLIDAEVGQVLRRAAALGEVRPDQARGALEDLAMLPLMRSGHATLLERAWGLRQNLTFCDALYVALAERLGMELLTLDARLARAPGVTVPIKLIG